jgi:hypothetical protein
MDRCRTSRKQVIAVFDVESLLAHLSQLWRRQQVFGDDCIVEIMKVLHDRPVLSNFFRRKRAVHLTHT